MARRRLDRVGLLLLGVALGFALSLLVVYLYVNAARKRVVEDQVRVALGLPEQAFELEDIEADGSLRILLRDVVFLDKSGDTIVSAPVARARLLASTLNGTGPIVFDEGEVLRPNLRLVQDARGAWNVFQIFAVEAGGQPVRRPGANGDEAAARPLVFRDLRIVDGRARVSTPSPTGPRPGPPARYASGGTPEVVRYGGRWVSLHYVTDLDATLGMVRVGGTTGWRVEIQRASAKVTNPDTRIEALAGWMEDRGDQKIRFDLQTFRTPFSALAGAGTIDVSGPTPAYDVRLRAAPLDLRDLAGMGLAVPREGTAAFNLALQTLPRGRTRWTVTDARVAILDSRASGRLTAITGPPGTEMVFTNTRLTLEPLYLRDLETLGFAERLPVGGQVRGTVASLDEVGAGGGALRLDLAATILPRTTADVPPSSVTLRGDVRVGGEGGATFSGLRVDADPLHLAALREAAADTAGFLRGTLRGGATLTGSLRSFRIEGGDLAYAVGGAPETRMRGLSGRVSLDPELRYSLEGRADPLALATLTELFPALPFRAATLSGPIRVSGTRQTAAFDVDLEGAAGGIEARGTLALGGAVPRFDVTGRLEAFRPGAVVTASTPVEGPLTGTFGARGSTEDFRFDVDLSQPGQGRFALGGTVRRPGGSTPQLDVAGRVENFQLGLALGQPGLIPGRVSGPIRVSGGGRAPYRFDVDLRGEAGVFDLEGSFTPGTVPSYAISGRVAGLDASGIPFLAWLPRTRLTGTVSVQGRGTTPETFVGRIDLDLAQGSTIGGLPVQTGIAHVSSDGAVLRVDTLLFAVRGARLEARGALGISRPAEVPLTFAFSAPNLAAIRPLIPGSDTLPDLAGSLSASGTVAGTVRAPSFGAAGEARGFRYGRWAAQALTFRAQGAKQPAGWTATANVEGRELEGAGTRLQALTLEVNATPGRASFGFAARRDAQTDLSAAGTLELVPGTLSVRGAILDNLALRIAGTEWRLNDRARVGYSADGGLAVENLLLRRTGPGGGYLAADGVIPPRGNADFRLHAEGIDLAEARRIFPSLPEISGRLRLDATLNGAVTDPRLTLDTRVDSLRYGGAFADSVHVIGSYAAGRLQAQAGVRVGAREVVNATATVPMTLTLGGIVPGFDLLEDGPLNASVVADSVPLGLLAASFPTYVTDARGVARARVTVEGTPADPRVSGSATLENGAFTVVALGARWERVNGRVSLAGQTIRVDSLTARTESNGRAFVNGTVTLDQPGSPLVDLAVRMEDFQVIERKDLADLEADAELALRGRLPGAELTGFVRLEDGEVFIPEFGEQAEADIVDVEVGEIGADTATAPQGGAALLAAIVPRNLRVLIGGGVWLTSSDARIQIQGDNLTIDRPPGSTVPLIYGDVEAVRGRYTFELGIVRREFEIVEGRVQFFGTPEINPALDITAEHEVRGGGGDEGITVVVNLTGTLQNPRVELSSNTRPPLPQSELVELLIFGRRADQLAGLTEEFTRGIFVQEALANLLTAELEEELVQAGIVDYLRVRTRATASAATGASTNSFGLDFLGPITVEAGREVVTNVFVSLQLVDILGNQVQVGAAVDWEISRTLSLRAAVEPVRRDPLLRELLNVSRQATVDLRARWEYGRPHPAVEADIGPRRRDRDEPPPGEPSTPTGDPPAPPPRGPRNDNDDEK